MTPRTGPLSVRLALAALLLAAPVAFAQDDDGPDAADLEDRERIEDLVRSLNNPVVLRVPGELRDRIDRLLSSRHPLARRKLRELLLDTGARTAVVEQIISSVFLDRDAFDLVADVIERLRVEQDSSLARSFDDLLLRYADTDLVRELSDLARDGDRTPGFRATAAATLGRTGHAEALHALVDLWGDPSPDVRLAASRGFVRIVPFVRSREDAQRVLREMREQQLPLTEVLRRELRDLSEESRSAPQDEFRQPYVELAGATLPFAPLAEILRLYVTSPLADVRAAAAIRLREMPWDDEPDPAAAQRATGKELLRALRREESVQVEAELLDTLVPLAPALRENVDGEELAALTVRARGDGGASRPVRRAAIRMLGALHDPRPIPLLKQEFDGLADTDPELRIEILAALGAGGTELTDWLAPRVLREPDVRVALEMVLRLGKEAKPASVGVFVQLLRDRHPDERVRLYSVQALASQWANSGVERARDALIDHGLTDSVVAIREISAKGLQSSSKGNPEVVLAALQRVVTDGDEDMKVRVAAARAIVELAGDDALARLRQVLSVGAIWDVYRNRRTDDLRGSHIVVDDVLRDADLLWADELPELRERAVELLRAVVDAGADLWESSKGRGRVRERLVERLLASGRPVDACAVAEGLLAATPREGDPRHRWRLLMGRALRACGSRDNLERAERELRALRGDTTLPAVLSGTVLLELGHTLLLRDDPTAALQVLAEIPEGAALAPEDAARLRTVRKEATERSESERVRILGLVDRVADDAARAELRRDSRRASRHIDAAIAAAGIGADVAALRRLLAAVSVLAGRTFELPAEATPDQVADVVARARAFLAGEMTAPDDGTRR